MTHLISNEFVRKAVNEEEIVREDEFVNDFFGELILSSDPPATAY